MEKGINLNLNQLAIINIILQVDKEGKQKTYSLGELQIANDIFKEIKNNVKDDKFQDGIVNFTSEQKVFITKLINEREWGVLDAEYIFELKELLN